MMWSAARALAVRDLQMLWRRRGDALQPALFALLVLVLFALALGNDPGTLARVAPGALWVAVLLSGLLALDTLFRGDARTLIEQWLLAPGRCWLVCASGNKWSTPRSHWCWRCPACRDDGVSARTLGMLLPRRSARR